MNNSENVSLFSIGNAYINVYIYQSVNQNMKVQSGIPDFIDIPDVHFSDIWIPEFV